MGGCASKPKDLNSGPDSPPDPPSPGPTVKNAEGDTVTKENNNGGKNQKEPLVDLSEPNPKTVNSDGNASPEPPNDLGDLVSGIEESLDANHVTAEKSEENGGAGNEITDQTKEPGVVTDLMGKPDIQVHESDATRHEKPLTSVT
uniref:Uncharacterized protein n=1 Tax=Nelumbo nucifera TaxID=4432 RepID=A0A822XEL8_NELNU|nr:TPA_asm: hypothetical protein HUJ06_019556 [Nelumbo nucifera]